MRLREGHDLGVGEGAGRLHVLVMLGSTGLLDNFRASYFTAAYNLLSTGERACSAFSSVCDTE